MAISRQSGSTGKRRRTKPVSSVSPEGARVDAPHQQRTKTAAASPQPSEQEELLRHVTSLAEELERQNQDLQRRQDTLHQQIAELESERRQCRLWACELQHQLEEREAKLQERAEELEATSKRLTGEAAQIEGRSQGLKRAAEKQVRREARLRAQADAGEHLESNQLRAELAKARREQADIRRSLNAVTHERQRLAAERQAWERQFDFLWRAMSRHRVVLEQREAALEATRRRWEAPAASPSVAEDELVHLQEDLERRRDEGARQQSRLEQQLAELQRERKALAGARAEFNQMREQRQADWEKQWVQLQQLSRRREESFAHQHALLDRRARDLEIRQAAAEQLRGEVDQAHREGLEMRLALEELWARLAEKKDPGALSQELAYVRAQIADYYRYANERLAQGHRKLNEAKAALACRIDEFHTQREELFGWVERRRKELDEEQHALRRRSMAFEEREAARGEQQQRWQDERLAYQSQIRRLLAQNNAETSSQGTSS